MKISFKYIILYYKILETLIDYLINLLTNAKNSFYTLKNLPHKRWHKLY